MSTIIFVEMPAFGHVNPSLPLVRELARRGERVVYYDDAEFQSVVEASGAVFRAYPPGLLTSGMIARATQTGDLIRVPRLILRATETLVPWLVDRLRTEQPDVVVLDSNALWGHIALRSLRLPAVSLLTTIFLGSAQFRQLRMREWLHMLRPMLPSVVPIAVKVIPQHAEQLVIGLTVAQHGAGLVRREHAAGQRLDAISLRRDVEQMLSTPRFKSAAAELQTLLRATGGFRQAADEVQAYVAAGRVA